MKSITRYLLCIAMFALGEASAQAQISAHQFRFTSMPHFDSAIYYSIKYGNPSKELGRLHASYTNNKLQTVTFTDSSGRITSGWGLSYDDKDSLATCTYAHSNLDPVVRDSFTYNETKNWIKSQQREQWSSPKKKRNTHWWEWDAPRLEWNAHWTATNNYYYDYYKRLTYIGPVGLDTVIRYTYDSQDRISRIYYRGQNGMSRYDSCVEMWEYSNDGFLISIEIATIKNSRERTTQGRYVFYGTQSSVPERMVSVSSYYTVLVNRIEDRQIDIDNMVSHQIDAKCSLAVGKEISLISDSVSIPVGEDREIDARFFSSVTGTFYDTLIVSIEGGRYIERTPIQAVFHVLSVDGEHTDPESILEVHGDRLELSADARDLMIHDITGRLVLHEAKPGEQVDLAILPRAQMYVISVRLPDGSRVVKKIIQP